MASVSRLEAEIRAKRFSAVAKAPAVTALKDVHLSVAAGEFVCILGPSGCGKTTLLNIVAGLERDYEGQVTFPDCNEHRPSIGYVFQQPRLLPWRTIEQNLRLVLRPTQDAATILQELLTATGLWDFRHAYPERLSLGMSRRVALARAFAVEPALLLLDEPFVSLDEGTADRLRQLLLKIWEQRPATVLFVTHDSREAAMLADRVIVMTPAPGTIQANIRLDMPRVQRTGPVLAALRQRILDPQMPGLLGQVDSGTPFPLRQ
jgi:ABC-type nitrate/sulfonate/bicarbonate transport system ATPase subunit